MAVPLVPGPGLGDANAAQKSMSTLLKNQCDFCAVLIETKHVGKNYASLLPLRTRSEEAPGGHLLLTFCATALLCRLQSRIPAGASSMPRALAAARNQKCKVYDDKVITCEPTSAANELYRAIGAKCPVEVPFVCGKN